MPQGRAGVLTRVGVSRTRVAEARALNEAAIRFDLFTSAGLHVLLDTLGAPSYTS
jgi:hypothetical protein